MAEVVRLIDWASNLHRSYDLTQTLLQLIGTGWVHWSNPVTKTQLKLTSWNISPGIATIVCTKTAEATVGAVKFLAVYYNTANVPVTLGPDVKVYIEIKDSYVQYPATMADTPPNNNFAQWLTIGQIKFTTDYPSHSNYLKLYECDGSWNPVDVRTIVDVNPAGIDLSSYAGAIAGATLAIAGAVTIGWTLTAPNATIGWYNVVTQLTPSFVSYAGSWTITNVVTQRNMLFTGSGGSNTITLPPAFGNLWVELLIKNGGTGNHTAVRQGSDTIDGKNGVTMPPDDAMRVKSDGVSDRRIVGYLSWISATTIVAWIINTARVNGTGSVGSAWAVSSWTPTSIVSWTIKKNGTYRIAYNMTGSSWGWSTQAFGRIYKNWAPFWTAFATALGASWTFTEDLAFAKWDTIELFMNTWGSGIAYLDQFKVTFDLNYWISF